MKRVLTFLALMLLPLSVMAMTPVTDSDLAGVTGQAGVNINADLLMNVSIGTMAWGDADGLSSKFTAGATNAADAHGYIGISNFAINNLHIRAREGDNWNGYTESVNLKPITIDVATGTKGTWTGTFVRMGLGSLEISMDALDFGVWLGPNAATFATTGRKLGDVYIGSIDLFINPNSYVDIYNNRAAGLAGVTMDINVTIDRFIMSTVSWGDSDGLTSADAYAANGWIATTGDPGAGFVGLASLLINGPIVITGQVNIDVASINAGKYALNTNYYDASQGKAVVHIGFGGVGKVFTVDVQGAITADVKLSPEKTLSDATLSSTLGDIYIQGFKVDMAGTSWVDIWAH